MKKWFGILLGLVLIAVPVIAFACHTNLTVDVSACESISASGTYYGDSAYNKAELYLDGTMMAHQEEWGNPSVSFGATSAAPGNHEVVIKGYQYTRHGLFNWRWDLKATTSKTVAVAACYTLCDETVPGTPQATEYGVWSEWAYVRPGWEARTRSATTYSAPLMDKYTPSHVCTPGVPTTSTETEERGYNACKHGTIPGTTADAGDPVWGDWTFNVGLGIMERFGTQATYTPLMDAFDPRIECGGTPGSRDVYESEEYKYCETTNMTPGEWSEEIWDADAGAYYKTRTLTYTDVLDVEHVCKIETERSDRPVAACIFDPTLPIDSGATKDMYWQVTFTKEGQPDCYLVTWQRGENGKFINPAVRSQLCNCGYIADNAPFGGWVTMDCHGNYRYHGQPWGFFQPRLMEPNWSGTCAMGGC